MKARTVDVTMYCNSSDSMFASFDVNYFLLSFKIAIMLFCWFVFKMDRMGGLVLFDVKISLFLTVCVHVLNVDAHQYLLSWILEV